MLCRNPFVQGNIAHKCGQCLPCRINRSRVWSHRIMLENRLWTESAFVTLTYADEYLPLMKGDAVTYKGLRSGGATLVPEHLQLWLKRVRKVVAPAKLRFFAVGEYGQEGERREVWHPHYHVAAFGLKSCEYGDTRFSPQKRCLCPACKLVSSTWRYGSVHLGCIEPKSAEYIAGYTIKRMTRFDDVRLQGRYPEFSRMSLRPGIGAGAVDEVLRVLDDYDLQQPEFLPTALQYKKAKFMPLGCYLTARLRARSGIEVEAKEYAVQKAAEALQPLRKIAEALSDPAIYVKGTYNKEIFRRLIVEQDAEKVRQIEARRKLYKGKNK